MAVRFNPDTLGVAVNQYLRSPATAQQFRIDSVIVQPSASLMKKLKSGQKITDGLCVETCIMQRLFWNPIGVLFWGHLGMDEVHLAKGFVCNVKNDTVRGVTKDFYDVNKIMRNLIDEDEIDHTYQPVVNAHQFSYRSTSGEVFNVMTFFNNGSLTASVALQQVFYCIMSCESVGCRIFGLISDAAGSMR